MKTLGELKTVSNIFFQKCDKLTGAKPWLVCIAMHEYIRNLYPGDPYIKFPRGICHTERLYNVTADLIEWLSCAKRIGNYAMAFQRLREIGEVKTKTGIVYGNLWSKFSYEELTKNATNIIRERLTSSGFDVSCLKGKHAIDIGCGSGRFTMALRRLGCDSVVGVDYGDQGLRVARMVLRKLKMRNVRFIKHNVLRLPFKDEKFDFVFCNGVLHHTENMEKGIKEMIRVAKKGAKIWFFIYGNGGIYWYARRQMRLVMKKIPQEYTIKVLDIIGMPSNRFIFCDTWYVPIERHTTDKEARGILKEFGIKKIIRAERGRSTDLQYAFVKKSKPGKIMWGDGELRYFLEK